MVTVLCRRCPWCCAGGARIGDIDEVKLASCGLTGNAADVRVAQGGNFDKASAYKRRALAPPATFTKASAFAESQAFRAT
jgi:hypothetical protein